MKTAKWIFIISQVLIFSTSLVLNLHAAEKKPIELRYATFFPTTDKQAQLGDAWSKEIEKRTNGNVKIIYIPGGAFVRGDEIYEGILIGAADIGMSAFAYNRRLFPAMEAIDFSIGYPSAKVATSVINDFYKKFRPKELSNVKVLYLHAHGPGLLHSKKPVYRLEDLKRMRIRPTYFSAEVTRALGAEPIVKPQGYTRVLLEDNYVDATWSPMEVLKGWRQAEVIKYTIVPSWTSYTSGFYVAMNLKKWNSLPNDVQKVFEEVSREWITRHAEAWDSSDDEGRKFTLSLGNKIISLSKEESARWCRAVQPVIDQYIKRIESKGLPGKEYVETIRNLIKKYK
ncbi:MAG: TRAP transporter substrate-binding protein [Deltaproteobacteria bacterium]|nr:TRAP transporter substrate-binding protein [Deltaproteobacteria bacterium]